MTQTNLDGFSLFNKISILLSIHYSLFKAESKRLTRFDWKIIISATIFGLIGFTSMMHLVYEIEGLKKAIVVTLVTIFLSLCVTCGVWLHSIHRKN